MNKLDAHIRSALRSVYTGNEAAWLSRIVCCEMLGQSVTDYYLGKDIVLSAKQEEKVADVLRRLLGGEPIQYIQQKALFCGMELYVSPDVLIPRPETEELVEQILSENQLDAPGILDIGTGSGCIAIALKRGIPNAKVTAIDISPTALDVARRNASAMQADCRFEQQDIMAFDPSERACSVDIIVSNPPYVAEHEKAEMERNVLDWEPPVALFVPDGDPLRFYRRIGEVGQTLLRPYGRLYFEINRAYGRQTAALLRGQGYREVSVKKDISGNDRFVEARK